MLLCPPWTMARVSSLQQIIVYFAPGGVVDDTQNNTPGDNAKDTGQCRIKIGKAIR